LEKIKNHLSSQPDEAAWKMISGRFQRLKCAFGTEATATPWLKLDVPLSNPNEDYIDAEIYDGQMQIAWYVCCLSRCFTALRPLLIHCQGGFEARF
jgi:hypothetical protein